MTIERSTLPPGAAAEFGDWVRPHWRGMAMLAARLVGEQDGEDVLQEAFANAWRKRGQFDPGRGSARNWLTVTGVDGMTLTAHRH